MFRIYFTRSLLFNLLIILFFSQNGLTETVRYGEKLCENQSYECIQVQKGESWHSLWPDPEQREKTKRLNRMNIRLREGMKIAVPKEFTESELSPFPQKISASGEKQIHVDLSVLAWGAYDPDGNLVKWGPASGGKNWCPDTKMKCKTISGEFYIFSKKGSSCKSNKFPIPNGGAKMPYCMHFYSSFAIHGSNNVPGYNASHGCARIFQEDAKWLNKEFVTVSSRNRTKVIVSSY